MAERVLVVTNETLTDADEVPEPLRPIFDEAEEIYVIAPTLTTWLQWVASDVDHARVLADERLHGVFAHMHAAGLEPAGTVAGENQVTAIADALAKFDADLIVLRLHAPGSERENWREHRIANQVRGHFHLPTIVFFFDEDGQVVGRENA
jgi:nucleotide-binding universal stress UspA family protein